MARAICYICIFVSDLPHEYVNGMQQYLLQIPLHVKLSQRASTKVGSVVKKEYNRMVSGLPSMMFYSWIAGDVYTESFSQDRTGIFGSTRHSLRGALRSFYRAKVVEQDTVLYEIGTHTLHVGYIAWARVFCPKAGRS